MGTLAVAGDIEGFVKFPGETPPPVMIANAVDAACPSGIGETNLIVHQENRGLRNALVMLDYKEDVPTPRPVPIGLKVEKCVFLPRVQWTTIPASLTLTNHEDITQDVHATIDGVRVFDVDLSGRGTSLRRPLTRAKFYKIESRQHPWMQAWIFAASNPYVALTDEQGHFVIRHVPSGHWTLRAWHEGWLPKGKDHEGHHDYQHEEETRRVHVSSDGRVEVIFEGLAPTF